MNATHGLALVLTLLVAPSPRADRWPAAKAPVIPEADGYVAIPNAAATPAHDSTYRAIFDATRSADDPKHLAPALNMVGSELNALGVCDVPLHNAKFAVVFHGAAIGAILADASYHAQFGTSNPNLAVIAKLKKAGVELFVCGQNLAADGIDPKTLTPDVTVASDALLVLIRYQNDGYALLSF